MNHQRLTGRQFHLLEESPSKWPPRIVRFGVRQIGERIEEGLVRTGLTKRVPASLDSAVPDPFRRTRVGDLLRKNMQERFFIQPADRKEVLDGLHKVSPDAEKAIIAEADRICLHIFDLLGSGPTPLGERIDWHVDFKTGHRWNPRSLYKRIRPAPYPGGFDIKVPWELSRCHHFVRLGQAYWITEKERYAREFMAQVEDWMEHNPWPFGVNWNCTMEVAIRAVNWLWGIAFFLGSSHLTDEFLFKICRSLLIHGRHIMNNLEGSKKSALTSNHYLSNLAGLVYLAVCCPFFKEAEQWLKLGTEELWSEMLKQVYPDGVDFEASISYHRLATELFLSPILLCQRNGIPVPEAAVSRLEKMIEFVMAYTKPDGTAPLIGDNDNGRLLRLKVWADPEQEWKDHRYLLGLGACLFERGDFARAAEEDWEEGLWLLGRKAIHCREKHLLKGEKPTPIKSKAYPDSGFFVMRDQDLYMIIHAGTSGQKGNGGHGHNDTLGFELYAGGRAWLVDPGTYLYTPDYRSRNLFRSTAYHNTVRVDDQEISPFRGSQLFQMSNHAHPRVRIWQVGEKSDLLIAMHSGYQRFRRPVWHQRAICFDKERTLWVIQDTFEGEGDHQLDWYFHLAPGVEAEQLDDPPGISIRHSGSPEALSIIPVFQGFEFRIEKAETSSSYGKRAQSSVLHFSRKTPMPVRSNFVIQYAKGDTLDKVGLDPLEVLRAFELRPALKAMNDISTGKGMARQ